MNWIDEREITLNHMRVVIPQVQAIDIVPRLPTKLSLPYPVGKKAVPITTMQFEGQCKSTVARSRFAGYKAYTPSLGAY